jgi:hypothetical protein
VTNSCEHSNESSDNFLTSRVSASRHRVGLKHHSYGEISCYHDGEYEDDMMEAASTSETSVNFYQTTRPNNPEHQH